MAVQKATGAQTDCGLSGEDLRGKEDLFCKRMSDGKIYVCGENEVVAGVISEGRNVGYHTSFNTGNMLRVRAGGGTINPGDKVVSNSQGKAAVGSTNNAVAGYARSRTTAEDQILEVEIDRT